jgi:hypothetical protein
MKIHLNTFFYFLAAIVIINTGACSSPPPDPYHVQKKYWDANDYENAIFIIKYNASSGKPLPCYASPDKAAFAKLVDVNNFKVVMDDQALGLNFRKEFSKKMFDFYREMFEAYQGLDNKDKFVYPKELAEIMTFGLELQINYFKLGNEAIKKESDNPNSQEVQDVIRRNEQTLVNNFTVDLNYVKREKAFSDEALAIYTAGIEKFFNQLITEFPNADYSEMLSMANLMQAKAETTVMKNMLTNLITNLETKSKKGASKKSA